MNFPSLEQIYDMDLDNLLSLKFDIEQNKINFNILPLDEDDYDLYDYNNPKDKDSILDLINSEIKERESTKELLNFFTDLNYDSNINTIESKFLQELNNNKNNNIIKKPQIEDKIIKKTVEPKNINNGYQNNKNIFNKSNNLNQPLKITPNEGIKSLLNRTKIDPIQLQYTVSSNKYVDQFWSIDKERKNRKKMQNNNKNSEISNNTNNTNFSSNISHNSHPSYKSLNKNKSEKKNFVISEKIVIGAIPKEQNKTKKVKKKRKKTKYNKEDEVKKINTFELMRNYKVSDITQFLKKKTTLKPLNISTTNNKNHDINKNNFNGKEYIPNIKLYNKTKSIQNNEKHAEKNKNELGKENVNNNKNIKINQNIQEKTNLNIQEKKLDNKKNKIIWK